jgi:putative membrane protein
MSLEIALAVMHHLAALSIAAVLFAELQLLRLHPDPLWLRTLRRADLAYGLAALALLAAGVGRVLLGPKGAAFYLGNPLFWLKLAVFGVIGLLSIAPTVRFARWMRAFGSQAALPSASERQATRRWVIAQLALLPLLPVCAVLLSHGVGAGSLLALHR